MEFFKQEYWSGQLFPSPENIPDPRIRPGSPALQTDSLPSKQNFKKSNIYMCVCIKYLYNKYVEKEMETHASIVAWGIPWTEEAGRLQSTGSQKSKT